MKKAIAPLIAVLLMAFSVFAVDMTEVSFVTPFMGVDDDTSGWSVDDTMVNLGTDTVNILGGTGTAMAYGGDEVLTQRGTRGLGVAGLEDDEIHLVPPPVNEKIEIVFDSPRKVTYLEVRSFYYENEINEEGDADFYLNDAMVYNEHFVGVDPEGTSDGILGYHYDGIWADKIVFYVPEGMEYTEQSDFAVAKLELDDTEIPEFGLVAGVVAVVAALGGMLLLRKR